MKLRVLVIALLLLAPLTPSISATPPKAGAICSKAGITKNYNGKKYTCVKNGNKLVWNKGVALKKPTPPATTTPTPTETATQIPKASDLKPGLFQAEYLEYHDDISDWFSSRKPWKTSVVNSVNIINPINPVDYFSIQWTGYFIASESGKWTFSSTSDDGSGVWIGESAIPKTATTVAMLSAPGIHGPYTITRQTLMEKGFIYPIRIIFGDKTNWAQMTLKVQAPSAKEPTVNLENLVWHSSISSENFSGIDPEFASNQIKKQERINNLQIPNVTNPKTLDSLELCKLKNTNTSAGNGRGFPRSQGRLSTIGKIKGMVLFVEFNNVKGGKDTDKRFREYVGEFQKFYSSQSYGKLSIEMDYFPSYLKINKDSSTYGMKNHNGGNPWLYIRDALDAADPYVDFNPYDFVVAIPPIDIKDIVYGPAFPVAIWDEQLKTNEKIILNATVAGSDSINNPKGQWWWTAHEVGHLFGLEHQYTWENVNYSTQLRAIWDLMDSGDNTPEFLAWHRFVLDWLDSETILCINKETRKGTETIHFLSPIASQDNQPKAIMVRLNEYEAIVIEVRRNLGFDKISNVNEGTIAYKVNVRDIGKSQEVMPLTNQSFTQGSTIVGNLVPGDTLTESGVEITILNSTKAGDYIKIKY